VLDLSMIGATVSGISLPASDFSDLGSRRLSM